MSDSPPAASAPPTRFGARWRWGLGVAVLVLVAGSTVALVSAFAGDDDGGSAGPTSIAENDAGTAEDNAGTGDEPPMLNLAAAGDVGTGESDEWRTAEVMDDFERDNDYEALLLLGDNVYPDGDPDELERVVMDPFRDVLDNGTRLLPVLGNHDVDDGFGPAQADKLGMPAMWYATSFGDVLIVSLDSNDPYNSDQLDWLEQTLADSSERWKIVTLHHPPYSAGEHGSSLDVRDAFVGLFEEYGVQLVLSGHDHDYQRTTEMSGVTYVVSGGAAQLRPTGAEDFTEYSESVLHFVDIAIWPDRLEVGAIDHDGTYFDFVSIEP